MGYRLRLDIKDENGNYIVQDVNERGFVSNTIGVTNEELPTLMKELTDMCEDESSHMLDALRDVYQMFEPKSIEFKMKE